MNEVAHQINALTHVADGIGFIPPPKAGMPSATDWKLKGLLTSNGTWVTIENYANLTLAQDALVLVRKRLPFSEKVHIRDNDAFAVFAVEQITHIHYLGGVLRG